MISFPNCKINLGLNIIKKKEDGFHNLETVFFPILLTDILEIIPSHKTELIITGLQVGAEDNLCIKAYNLLKNDFPELPPCKMHLHKVIPMGAGLGGGSSDAAFTLKLLNEKFKLDLRDDKLHEYAQNLGSDAPFFLINKPCYATGRGELLEPISIDLKNYKLILVNPGIHVDTKWAFSKIIPAKKNISIKEVITKPVKAWSNQLTNDFETPVFAEYPNIANLKSELYQQGALYASMSGSGSTVYGIFNKDEIINTSIWNDYFYKIINF